MSVTSDEVNFLVYRYLQESGFTHSSFTFAYESLITKSSVTASDLPPGALISLLQKGLQYVEIEAHLNEDGTKRDMPDPFALLMPYAVRKRARMEKDAGDTDGASSSSAVARKATIVRSDEVTMLRGHSSEVFICSWNPKHDLLASGSKDSTARIWGIPNGASGMASGEVASLHPRVLSHGGEAISSSSSSSSSSEAAAEAEGGHKDVTTLDWDPSGKLLATGTFDGQARIWDQDGTLVSTLKAHTGPIFSLKWNKSGTALLSGSVDKTAIVWDPSNGTVKQQFKFHTDPTLDVDWRDDDTFATCSTDKLIHVCQIGKDTPVKTFQGHVDEVNAIKWSPNGNLLASCSDDNTAKVWSLEASGNGMVHDFTDHDKEVYTIRWSPTGPGSNNPNAPLVLASASFDSTIRLWDPETGTCLHSLVKHSHPVYSVAFSPDGQFLASGAFDKCLHIWSVKDGSLVKTYNGPGGIFDVCWNANGTKVAAGFSDNTVACFDTIDLRM